MAKAKKKENLSLEEKLEQALVPVEEQPYEVPENWCWVRVGSLCTFIGGGTPSKNNENFWNGNIPWASVKDIKGDYLYSTIDCISEEGINNSATNLCEIDDLLLVTRIEPGKTIISRIETTINQDLKIVKSSLDSRYLHYYFETFKNEFRLKSSGSTVKGLTIANVANTEFPLATLKEQQRIVEKIERLFSKLDEAKEKAQEAVEAFENVQSAIMYDAFSGKLTESWRRKINRDDSTWREYTIQDVCSMKITDGTHKTPTYCEKEEGGFPFISSKDVTTKRICWDNIKYIVPELHDELYARLAPQVDDILLAKNGTTGVAAIVEDDRVFDIYVTLAVLRPNKDIIYPRYLLNIVNSPVCKNQFDKHLTGIGVPNLHLRDIKEVRIHVPELDEQAEVVRLVDNIIEKERKAAEIAEKTIDRVDLMKKSILAKAFRGGLGTNNLEDENSIELLKQILKKG